MEVTNLDHEPCWSPIDPVQVSKLKRCFMSGIYTLNPLSHHFFIRYGIYLGDLFQYQFESNLVNLEAVANDLP